MTDNKKIIDSISNVKHPAINHSLLNLGIVKDIELSENTVVTTFAFPFPNIPIADQLVNSIASPIKKLGFDFQHITLLMTESEKAKFLKMETEAWTGL